MSQGVRIVNFILRQSLNARNFFALNQADPFTGQEIAGSARPKTRYNDFGYDFGGPIKKDRLFFFWSEEWRRIIQSTGTYTAHVPTAYQRNGTFQGIAITNPAGITTAAGGPCVTVTGSTDRPVSAIDPACVDPNATILLN